MFVPFGPARSLGCLLRAAITDVGCPKRSSGTSMLLAGGCLVLGNKVGWHAAALLDVVAVLLRPLAHGHGVDSAGLTADAGGGTSGAADLAGMGDEVLEGVVQLVA